MALSILAPHWVHIAAVPKRKITVKIATITYNLLFFVVASLVPLFILKSKETFINIIVSF